MDEQDGDAGETAGRNPRSDAGHCLRVPSSGARQARSYGLDGFHDVYVRLTRTPGGFGPRGVFGIGSCRELCISNELQRPTYAVSVSNGLSPPTHSKLYAPP